MFIAVAAPWIAPYDPYLIVPSAILEPPSFAHWAGTDEVGRDIFSRILHGTRPSLLVALGIIGIAATFGTLIGAASGLVGGVVDGIVMRIVDTVMALPGLVIALALTAALGPSLVNLTLALGVLGVPFYIRVARGQTLSLRERPYVHAARTIGAKTPYLIIRHIIPHLLPTIVVFASLGLSGALLAASGLSFIGLGAQPPLAEWGALVFAGRNYILSEWWYALLPGLAVMIASLGFNCLGDGLRDLLDPKDVAR
jgi:peptide/nickel transport system permease protein